MMNVEYAPVLSSEVKLTTDEVTKAISYWGKVEAILDGKGVCGKCYIITFKTPIELNVKRSIMSIGHHGGMLNYTPFRLRSDYDAKAKTWDLPKRFISRNKMMCELRVEPHDYLLLRDYLSADAQKKLFNCGRGMDEDDLNVLLEKEFTKEELKTMALDIIREAGLRLLNHGIHNIYNNRTESYELPTEEIINKYCALRHRDDSCMWTRIL